MTMILQTAVMSQMGAFDEGVPDIRLIIHRFLLVLTTHLSLCHTPCFAFLLISNLCAHKHDA